MENICHRRLVGQQVRNLKERSSKLDVSARLGIFDLSQILNYLLARGPPTPNNGWVRA